MLHRVLKRKYTTPQPAQIPNEVDRERYYVVTGSLSW